MCLLLQRACLEGVSDMQHACHVIKLEKVDERRKGLSQMINTTSVHNTNEQGKA
jgi:hypothetical protein